MANIGLIRRLALQRGLDPAAVLAVASAEGLSGGIGDGGHAFGPFQLNNAGGVLTGQNHGNAQQTNAWAWSKPGLISALNQIAGVARGQHGQSAVNSIVRRFERPAAPDAEVQRALGAYSKFQGGNGGFSGGGASNDMPALGLSRGNQALGSLTPPTGSNRRSAFLNQLIQGIIAGRDPSTSIPQALAAGRAQEAVQAPALVPTHVTPPLRLTTAPVASQTVGRGGIAELLHEGLGGATHSTGEHIHAAFTNPQSTLQAIRLAQSLGLRVGENPYTDTVDPVHAKNSYHYRQFPGLFQGKHLGQAIDVTGTQMNTFYQRLAALRGS